MAVEGRPQKAKRTRCRSTISRRCVLRQCCGGVVLGARWRRGQGPGRVSACLLPPGAGRFVVSVSLSFSACPSLDRAKPFGRGVQAAESSDSSDQGSGDESD